MADGLGLADGLVDLVVVNGTLMQTHGPKMCVGSWCSLHQPSDHPLKNAPLVWSTEVATMFRVCSHLALHPDPDALSYARWRMGIVRTAWHECCEGLCCGWLSES